MAQIPKIGARDEFGRAIENIALSAQQIVFGQADEKVRYRARVERMYRSRMMRRHKHGK
jgi:hypothetical protein